MKTGFHVTHRLRRLSLFFAELAIKFNSFEEHERGGLLIEDEVEKNTLHYLVVDSIYLAVLIRLRQSNY